MASNTFSSDMANQRVAELLPGKVATDDSVWSEIRDAVRPLASLKITVTLFALSIFLILAGTLAQTEKNMWEVMGQYFYPYIAWIDIRVFFPYSFFPDWPAKLPDLRESKFAFPFPGGAFIGVAMFVNLGAAFISRFPLQARGTRLVVGAAVLLAGAIVTAVVILGGHNTEGLQAQPILGPQGMWTLFQASLVLLWVSGGIWLWTMEAERKAERRLLLGAEIGLFLVLLVLFWQGRSMQIGESSMRILWQLMQGTFAGLVLLAACLLLFKRRGGVVLIHMAVALLMFGQWMVSQYDVESRITIEEGQTVNFTRDIRSTELAVIDTSGKDEDHVVVIPLNVNGRDSSFLRTTEPIQHEDLPFRVEIVNYFKNARIRKAEGDETSPVTAGGSIGYIADAERASSGADSSGEVDFAAAYVKFIDKASDKSLGTYLLTQVLSEQEIAEEVVVGDEDSDESKTYHVALRFRRDYKPYSLHLVDVRKDDYMGTSTPRNYSSEVWLVDPTRGENRPVKIWMNNPLRFAGETFYQSGYRVDPRLGKEITDLQVVKNYGWMIPYVACMLAVVGMLAHFTMTLVRYIERAQRESTSRAIAGNSQVIAAQLADDDKSSHSPKTKREKKRRKDQGPAPELLGNQMAGYSGASSAVLMASVGAALLMVLLAGGFLAGRAKRPSYEGNAMNLYEAGKLPVMYQGRMKPLDTLARNSLRMIANNRETFKDQAGDRQPAIRWLLDTISGSDAAREHQVFYIHHPDVLTTLGLERRKSHLYSVEELLPNIARFEEQVSEARKLPTEQLDDYQRQLLVLDRRIRTFTLISAAFRPLPFPEFPTQEEYEADKEAATQKLFQIKQMMDAAPEAEQELMRMEPPLVIPTLTGDGQWSSYGPAWNKAYLQREVLKEDVNPATQSWASIFAAYREGNGAEFNRQVELYLKQLGDDLPDDTSSQFKKVGFESYFNNFRPFLWSSWLYLFVFVLVLGSWLVSIGSYQWGRPLNWAAFALVVVLFAVHTFGIVARIYISGRPPVTNLYSSAVFIGWGAVLFGLVIEGIFRLGIGNLLAAVAGFSTLQIADGLAGDGDTLAVLQAVLDTQFWLSTHVVCISLGYVATFVAGFLGLVFAIGGMASPMSAGIRRTIYWMIYGTVCFAMFFSFWGTVLGGLWADDSWGRFWGWDPKENGALIIVIWNALILHARWDGMVKERGFALLAVAGNIVTAWSWFGVNELGVGLHSYGFTDGVLFRLGMFALSQLAVILIGVLLPRRLWWSYSRDNHSVEAQG